MVCVTGAMIIQHTTWFNSPFHRMRDRSTTGYRALAREISAWLYSLLFPRLFPRGFYLETYHYSGLQAILWKCWDLVGVWSRTSRRWLTFIATLSWYSSGYLTSLPAVESSIATSLVYLVHNHRLWLTPWKINSSKLPLFPSRHLLYSPYSFYIFPPTVFFMAALKQILLLFSSLWRIMCIVPKTLVVGSTWMIFSSKLYCPLHMPFLGSAAA